VTDGKIGVGSKTFLTLVVTGKLINVFRESTMAENKLKKY
jgi:hypothetical protein